MGERQRGGCEDGAGWTGVARTGLEKTGYGGWDDVRHREKDRVDGGRKRNRRRTRTRRSGR